MFRILVLILAVIGVTLASSEDDPWSNGKEICCGPDNFVIHYDVTEPDYPLQKLSVYRRKTVDGNGDVTEDMERVDWDNYREVYIGVGTDQEKYYEILVIDGEEVCLAVDEYNGEYYDSDEGHCTNDGVLTEDTTADTTITLSEGGTPIPVQPYTYSTMESGSTEAETGKYVLTVPDAEGKCFLVTVTGGPTYIFSKIATSYSAEVQDASAFDVTACAQTAQSNGGTRRRRKRSIKKRMPLF